MPDQAPLTLRQRQEWRETMEFTLADDELSFTARCGGSESSARVPLADIDDLTWEAPNVKGNAWLAATVITGLVAFASLISVVLKGGFHDMAFQSDFAAALALGGGVSVAVAAFFFRTWRRLKRRTYIQLFHRPTGNAFCAIRADDPTPGEAARFVEKVTADARRISLEGEEQAWVSASRLHAPREIRRFHDLMKEGVLTPDEFAAKKKSLIEGFLAE